MTELISVVEPSTLRLTGIVERRWAHEKGLCHLTTLLMPIRCVDTNLTVQIRPAGKSHAGARDFFGGHVGCDGAFWGELLGGRFDLGALVRASAVREANEELLLSDEHGVPRPVGPEQLVMVGELGEFRWDDPRNVERSTLFLVRIPEGWSMHPMDDVEGRNVQLETTHHRLEEVLQRYRDKRWTFADGAERVLRRLDAEPSLRQDVQAIISAMPEEGRQQFRAVLWDYPEGAPGGGGPDSTFSYEQLPKTEYYARYADALLAGRALNRESGGDFYIRIEKRQVAGDVKAMLRIRSSVQS